MVAIFGSSFFNLQTNTRTRMLRNLTMGYNIANISYHCETVYTGENALGSPNLVGIGLDKCWIDSIESDLFNAR